MYKTKIFNVLKIIVIVLLLMGISFLVLVQWRSDAIIRKVVALIQHEMQDSLHYEDISLEWFRYFPSAALELKGLTIGPSESPLIRNGNVDVVLRIFPLLQEKIIINKLLIADSRINITRRKGRWSYDLFKTAKPNDIQKADIAPVNDTSGWETMVRKLELKNDFIVYNDGEGMTFTLEVNEGEIAGNITGNLLDTEIELSGTLDSLVTGSYKQARKFEFEMTGDYKYDAKSGRQELKDWLIHHDGLDMEAAGHLRKEEEQQWMDMRITWSDADPAVIKSFLPKQDIKHWNEYQLAGKSSGKVEIKGYSSKTASPRIQLASELKKGSIKFPGEGGQLKNMLLDIAYDSGDAKSKNQSYLRANLRSAAFEGNELKADMRIDNMDQPLMSLDMNGSLPASLLNLFLDSASWNFKEGLFDIDHYKISGLNIKTVSTKTFIDKSETKLKAEGVRFHFSGDDMFIKNGGVNLDEKGNMRIEMNEFVWNSAKGEDISGELAFTGDQVNFDIGGNHSEGKINVKGIVSGLGSKPVLDADWKIKGIEMQELLSSFKNFDQTFITSEHLNGKADIWTHSTIPYDANGNINAKGVTIMAAIEIKDGRLKNLKTLEDFSKYVHLDDLRDVRFNELRNYMKIEDGKVYLPVMFLQSSAINMSINGVHSFNHEILYNLKINAGQAAANKLKKFDPLKSLKKAKKSGWINLYFVLSGTVENVKYEQDQKQVISSFEQSTQLKENLRNYLVDRFGHDVYWLEPNEWEDIPEYK